MTRSSVLRSWGTRRLTAGALRLRLLAPALLVVTAACDSHQGQDGAAGEAARPPSDTPRVVVPPGAILPPPDSLGLDREFYAKYTDAGGIPVISSAVVPDEALIVARDIVDHMLLERPDLRAYMVADGQRVGVMAVSESTTDLPEQRDWKKPAFDDPRLTDRERERYYEPGGIASMTDKEYWDRRARGMGGRYTTGAEENVLGYPNTRYYGENILVHEFSHAVMRAIRAVDPDLMAGIRAAYDDAMRSGRFAGHYAANTVAEYWAEGTQWWFWSNYEACLGNVKLWSPDQLRHYDPKLFDLLGRVYPDHHIPADVYHGANVRPCESRGNR